MAEDKSNLELIPVLEQMSKPQRFVTRIGAMFCCLLLSGIILVTTASVFSRYILSTPLNFADQLSAYALAWICFVGSGVVLAHGDHVAVDFFEKRMPVLLQKAAYLIYVISFSVFLIAMIYYGFIYAWGVRKSIDPLLLNNEYDDSLSICSSGLRVHVIATETELDFSLELGSIAGLGEQDGND